MKLSVSLALLLCCAGARIARADTDGGVPPGGPTPPPAAPADQPPTVEPAADSAGGGLFEQSNAAAAAAAPSASAAPAAAATGPFTLTGYVRGDMFAGKVSGADAAEMKAGYGELDLTVRTAKETYGDGFAEARLRYGLQADGLQVTVVEVREAYVNAYLGPLDLRLGQQIIVWGRADALNPTNNLTPLDFRIHSPIEDDIRLGNAGARAFLRFAPFRLEGVWMPLYLPTELPVVALPQYVSYGAPLFPSLNLKDGTEAVRLHLELPAIEMSVSYLHGFALLPGLSPTPTGTPSPRPRTERRSPRCRRPSSCRGPRTSSRCWASTSRPLSASSPPCAARQPTGAPTTGMYRPITTSPIPTCSTRLRRPHLRLAEHHRPIHGALRVRLG